MSNLDATGWSRLRAVCICAAGVDMIMMLEEKRSRRAILCGIPALADTGTDDMQAIIARERAAGVDVLALAEVTYPDAAENDVITRVHAGFTRVYSTGRAHGPTVPVVTGRRPSPATATGWKYAVANPF